MTAAEERVVEWMGRMHLLHGPTVEELLPRDKADLARDVRTWMDELASRERTHLQQLLDALSDPRIRARITIDITSASPNALRQKDNHG